MKASAGVLASTMILMPMMCRADGESVEWLKSNAAVRIGVVSLENVSSKSQILSLALQLAPEDCGMWTVIYFGAAKDMALVLDQGPIEYFLPFDRWVGLVRGSLASSGSIGRLMCYRDNQVLTFREDGEHVEHEIVKGGDFSLMRGEGVRMRILHVAAVNPGSPRPLVKVFATTEGPLLAETGIAAWPNIRELFPNAFVELNVRRDTFHRGIGFPSVYPFWRTSRLPRSPDDLERILIRCYGEVLGTPKCRLEETIEP